MSSKRARSPERALATLASVLLACAACGAEVPKGGVAMGSPRPGFAIDRRIEPQELFPADLDLVVRVDLARMRGQLGKEATAQLLERAAADDDPWIAKAIASADVIWVGVRLADIEKGDRILVAEVKQGGGPDLEEWTPAESTNKQVGIFDRKRPAPRDGTARVVVLGDSAVAFVSPAEVSSVSRVLREGPDEDRGDPKAEGVISADMRARGLPPRLRAAYPSIGKIVAGIQRVRATATLVDEGGRLEAEIIATSADAAQRAHAFLRALRDNVEDPRYAPALRTADIEAVGSTVRVRWTIPARLLLALVSGPSDAPPAAPAAPPASAPPPRTERAPASPP